MSIEDQRRWFVTSPRFTAADGTDRADVIVVEAVTPRQAISLGVAAMRVNAKYGWPAAAERDGREATAGVTAAPVDEDDEATRMANRQVVHHSPFRVGHPVCR